MLNDLLHCCKLSIIAGPEETTFNTTLHVHPISLTDNSQEATDTVNHLQVQRCVPVDVDGVRLHVKVALQQETHNLVVTETSAEVERNVIFVVLCINWRRKRKKRWRKLPDRLQRRNLIGFRSECTEVVSRLFYNQRKVEFAFRCCFIYR